MTPKNNFKETHPYENSATRFDVDTNHAGWQCNHCDKAFLDRTQQHEAHMCCANDFACATPDCDNRLSKEDRYRTMCTDCRSNLSDRVWAERKYKKWDGTAMLYSDALGKYFSSPDDAYDYLEEPQVMEDLRLMMCEPTWVPSFDLYDLLADSLPEDHDGYIPGGAKIEKKVNEFITSLGILGWEASNYALDISEYSDVDPRQEFDGVIDSVKFSNRVLSPEEISDIYEGKVKPLKTVEDSWHTHFHRAAMAHPATEIMEHLRKGVQTTEKTPYDVKVCYHQVTVEMLDRRKKDRPLLNIEFIKVQSGLKKLLEMTAHRGTVTGRINCSKPNLSNLPRPKKCVCELNLVMNQGCKCGGS